MKRMRLPARIAGSFRTGARLPGHPSRWAPFSLTPRRDVRAVEGLLDDVLKGPQNGQSPDDYLLVTLLDRKPILDAIGKLRAVYPNVLQIERPQFAAVGEPRAAAEDYRRMGDAELFEAFFKEVTGEPIDDPQREAYVAIVEELHRQQREVAG